MRICACIGAASTHDGGVLPQPLSWAKGSHVPGDSQGPSFPATCVRRILSQSMTDNQGSNDGEGRPHGRDNPVGLSRRSHWWPGVLIILTAIKIMSKRL